MTTHPMEFQGRAGQYDIFSCSICDRTIMISWPPDYDLQIVTPGDIEAEHSGGVGGVMIDDIDIDDTPEVFVVYLEGLE